MYMYMYTSVLYVPVQIIHAYMAEPYAPWARLRRGSLEYKTLKEQRAEQLWGLIEKVCVCVCWGREEGWGSIYLALSSALC
jgi:hypothetical protein